MQTPKPPSDDDALPDPAALRRASAARRGDNATTTPNRRMSGALGTTPNSAPAAGGIRKRSASKAEPPTLLTAFLLGRPPGPAARQRRRSLDIVKAEMREAAVRKLKQPGGVRDRVGQWQKTSAKAMMRGDPTAAPSEPTDVAFNGEEESVTEEDRVRIKMRRKKKPMPKATAEGDNQGGQGGCQDEIPEDPRLRGPPKKRVISDDHWMKTKHKESPGKRNSPKDVKGANASPIPKDFLQRNAQNPPVSKKVQEWAAKVAIPDTPPLTKTFKTPKSRDSGDGIRVRPLDDPPAEKPDARQRRSTAKKSSRQSLEQDDGVMVMPTKKKQVIDDEVPVPPLQASMPDDGIRVRPIEESPTSRTAELVLPPSDFTEVLEDPPEVVEVAEEVETEVSTPTRKSGTRSRPNQKRNSRSRVTSHGDDKLDEGSWVSENEVSTQQPTQREGSDIASSVPTDSLADIPVGFSAFSELGLPLGADARNIRRPKAQRTPSFRAVTMGLKKVVSEGKKIIHDKVDPPKPISTKPPSIENWLSNTVDPFVDAPAAESTPPPKRKSIEREWVDETQARRLSSIETRQKEPASLVKETEENEENEENEEPGEKSEDAPPKEQPKTPVSAGLKRSRATRNSASPFKSTGRSSGKKPFREALKDAFKGESSAITHPLNNYISEEERRYRDEEDWERRGGHRRSSGSESSPPPAEDAPPPPEHSEQPAPSMAGPRKRPPTTGIHELSTIVSMASLSTVESDTVSTLSHTTITQATALTGDSELSRRQSQKSSLKRRLTKHSDLVSVLSLPDDSKVPPSLKNISSRPSVRRSRRKADTVTLEDLLKEFFEDEDLYQRELKTLVDGVVPVLLTQAIHGDGRTTTTLFGTDSSGQKANGMSKAVVSMGIALEKLRNAHRRAPLHDAPRLVSWLHTAVPVYDAYLDAWRLGFQDLIVNLAPSRPDDEDSLLNAMPRNEDGDVLDSDGQRVDVAHLLKRPLMRIKLMAKFAQGVDSIVPSDLARCVVDELEVLQEKARRRHKEESARMINEDAANTDTTKARDLRTLAALESIKIDPNRQVNAKDVFSLELAHSNGQRLECQVELVHRDNPSNPSDKGDLLIRETSNSRQSWLLFPPIPMTLASSRRGAGQYELVVMVRGTHNFRQWHELITLVTDNEEQVLDWMDILGTSPVPPAESTPSIVSAVSETQSPRNLAPDVPVGTAKLRKARPPSPDKGTSDPITPTKRPTPSRYHPRGASLPAAPGHGSPTDSQSSQERTPTQDSYNAGNIENDASRSRPLSEDMRPDPAVLKKQSPNSTPYRGDGAPPPPIHRTLGPPPQSLKSKSSDHKSPHGRRRTSSPLKHEYLPSDVSSTASDSVSDDSDTDSSGDEIDSADVPDTELGISIKKPPTVTPTESVISISSLTPSNSASQAGIHGHKRSESEPGVVRYMATISHWSEKRGQWKDLSIDPCSVIVGPGIIEAYTLNIGSPGKRSSTEADNGQGESSGPLPLLALDLTPLVLLRQSTVVDLEIRSAVQDNCRHRSLGGGNFRFRCPSQTECFNLYMAVHHARLNNERYIKLESDTRFKYFGERNAPADKDGDTSSSSRRRSWFGRKNSYRASARAPSQSQDGSTPSSSASASSFLKRLTGNSSFNIAGSSIDKQSRAGSGNTSLYTSGSSSAGGTPPRSPSISLDGSGKHGSVTLGSENIRMRLHLLVSSTKWEDYGNCILQVRRPPPGWHQDLRAYHGLEKRVTATTVPKKEGEAPRVVLDAVLGSACFTAMGSRGIVCGVWEEVRDEKGEIGMVPATGNASGNIKKWCFQCATVSEASWVMRLVHQEVVRA